MPPKRSTKPEAAPEPINTYGEKLYSDLTQLDYDRLAFARRIPIERGAPLRYTLFQRIANKLLPNYFEWHSWTDKVAGTLCEHSLVGFPGCSGAAKTYNVAGFATAWWMCDPDQSSVTLVSTSKQALRQRAWAEIQKCYTTIPGPRFGNFVGSRMVWQATKGDDKHAIIGKAVEEGSTQKVADDIKGVHTRRQMVVIDEATSVPPAIYEACANLYSYPEEFILILIGNPLNRMDQFGRFCEPENGWTSVDVETGQWDGKPQGGIGGRKPFVITFDAEKSPNILQGRIVSKHLPTKEEVEISRVNAGGGNSPLYWQNKRGFWPPDGLSKTVFSESAMKTYGAYDKHKFTGRNFSIIGAFDPAFGGGDRPALRFAKMGDVEGGKMGIESFPPIIIPINANSTNPVHFQLSEQLRRQCERFIVNGVTYDCPPENLAVDATGEGGGLCDIIQRTWSDKIIRVEFGGSASEDSCSLEDIRPANEVYQNKTVEMHFRSRDAVNSGQLKGVDQETSTELCNRQFDDSRKIIKLQSKKEYKLMFKKSPDFGDCLVMLTEVARRRGFKLAAIGNTVNKHHDWQQEVEKTQAVYENVDYADEVHSDMSIV